MVQAQLIFHFKFHNWNLLDQWYTGQFKGHYTSEASKLFLLNNKVDLGLWHVWRYQRRKNIESLLNTSEAKPKIGLYLILWPFLIFSQHVIHLFLSIQMPFLPERTNN